MLLVFVDEETRVRAVLPQLLDLVTDGMVEMHATEVLTAVTRSTKVIS